jgi:hypothetical protein
VALKNVTLDNPKPLEINYGEPIGDLRIAME